MNHEFAELEHRSGEIDLPFLPSSFNFRDRVGPKGFLSAIKVPFYMALKLFFVQLNSKQENFFELYGPKSEPYIHTYMHDQLRNCQSKDTKNINNALSASQIWQLGHYRPNLHCDTMHSNVLVISFKIKKSRGCLESFFDHGQTFNNDLPHPWTLQFSKCPRWGS